MSKLGLYIHIPYCLQRCSYCDFATEDWQNGLGEEDYRQLLIREIRLKSEFLPRKDLHTIYWGGGTPSLLSPKTMVAVLNELEKCGFSTSQCKEVSLEINPGTLDKTRVKDLLSIGFNRFSVGTQSFNDDLLKKVGRKHSALETRKTLQLLEECHAPYSFDLLFGIPGFELNELKSELEKLRQYQPQHLSAYCLTVPENHPLNRGRPTDEVEAAMYLLIEEELRQQGLLRYEISNYSRTGFESQHNLLYWSDESYWGIGMSAHSYLNTNGPFGTRFWNPPTTKAWKKSLETWPSSATTITEGLAGHAVEPLVLHESLTDFTHTHLRLLAGLSKEKLAKKYARPRLATQVVSRLNKLKMKGLLEETETHYRLSKEGKLLPNLVFSELTFLADEVIDFL